MKKDFPSLRHMFGFIFFLFFASCQSETSASAVELKLKNPAPKSKITIIIQPFNDFPAGTTSYIEKSVKNLYSKVIVKEPIQPPRNAFIASMNRYNADSLIRFLSKNTSKEFVTIGLTEADICTEKDKNPFYRIMGLGYRPGKACVASSSRLKGANRQEKLFKVAIHELGHNYGLDHCPITTCLMRDAKGKDHLNEEIEFCSACKKVLVKAGWDLK